MTRQSERAFITTGSSDVESISKMDQARNHIETIKEKYLGADREFILSSLSGAIDRIQKAFPRFSSFIMEFIQNADDAHSEKLMVELDGNLMTIKNTGDAFTSRNIDSICKVGRSSKTPKDYVGYLGVGFKSVFLLTDSVEIQSGDYSFKFDKNAFQEPETPWQVVPIWLEALRDKISAPFTTSFRFEIRESTLVEKVKDEFKPEHLSSRVLLFLRHLDEVEINFSEGTFRRQITKLMVTKTPEYEIIKVQEHTNAQLTEETTYLTFRRGVDVPNDVRQDPVTKEWERQEVDHREIVVAYRLHDDGNLVKEPKGTAHVGAFSFLPLKEIPTGLSFLFHADFLTNPGRTEFERESLWNQWIAGEVSRLIIEKCLPVFLSHDRWKMNFTQVLYSLEGGHELFEQKIKIPMRECIETNPVLINEEGLASRVDDVVLLTGVVRDLLSRDDIEKLFPGISVLHRNCRPSPGLQVKEPPEDPEDFLISEHGKALLLKKAGERDINWFMKLYQTFPQYYSYSYFSDKGGHYKVKHDDFWDHIRRSDIQFILSEDCELGKIESSFTNSDKLHIPEQISDELNIVHPELVKSDEFMSLRKKLNETRYHRQPPATKVLRDLTKDDVMKMLSERETMDLTPEKWETLDDSQRIAKIRDLQKAWSTKYLSLDKFKFLSLKSKSGHWTDPQKLVFPGTYGPDHNIEYLINRALIDKQIEFLSPEFIEGNHDTELTAWRRFFEQLGVDQILEDDSKNIAQRIGVLTSLQYERRKERNAKELGESEHKGFDIESTSIDETRYIEVKATSHTSTDILLTVNEFRAMKNLSDCFFVYVVVDAFRRPTLSVTRGTRLLEINDVKLIVPSNKWLTEAKEDEFQP